MKVALVELEATKVEAVRETKGFRQSSSDGSLCRRPWPGFGAEIVDRADLKHRSFKPVGISSKSPGSPTEPGDPSAKSDIKTLDERRVDYARPALRTVSNGLDQYGRNLNDAAGNADHPTFFIRVRSRDLH